MNKLRLDRRTLLQAMGTAAIAGVTASETRAEGVPWSAGTEQPKLKAPANACDCHMHIYDSRFPAAPNATLRPADAKPDDYRLLQKRIGTTRNVVVTPSTYGTDNSCTLDGMAKLGPTAHGVAVLDTSVSDAELKQFWPKLNPALQMVLLTGQRPGEVAHMRPEPGRRLVGNAG